MASTNATPLEPAQLASEALQACLALATGSLACDGFDEHRGAAYACACRLAETALQAAMAAAAPQPPVAGLEGALSELASITGLLAGRVIDAAPEAA